MQLEENKIYEVLKKIEIRIQGQTISKEKLLKSFGQYLSQTFSKWDHNIGLIMHTGSVCFDAMLVTYAMIFNLISNKVETGDVVNSFSEGDIVLYGQNKKSRYFFGGFVDGSEIRAEIGKKYIKLTQGGTSVNYIPEKSWRNIEPYNGDSVRMDGRGIRKKSSLRDDFFVEVLGFTKENIPSVLDTSCVIVAPRDRVDYLVKNISLAFGKKKISLLELVTASYFTEEDEYRYGGNAGKNEPTLKFTAKVSAARQLLLSRQGNRHLGLIVLGEDSISRGYSELHELINRKSLQYVYLSSSIDSELAFALTSDIEETEVFACTKNFLLENSTTDIAEINDYTLKLSKQANLLQTIHDAVIDNDEVEGTFYVFYDRLQLIQASRIPKYISEADCKLTLYKNCRNTENIAITSLKPISQRTPKLYDGAIKGVPARIHFREDSQEAIERIETLIDELKNEGITDVVILTCKSEFKSILKENSDNGTFKKKVFTTCRKFKGLEADAIILIDVDEDTFGSEAVQRFYVGASRARLRLEIVTTMTDENCEKVLREVVDYKKKIKNAKRELALAFNAMPIIE